MKILVYFSSFVIWFVFEILKEKVQSKKAKNSESNSDQTSYSKIARSYDSADQLSANVESLIDQAYNHPIYVLIRKIWIYGVVVLFGVPACLIVIVSLIVLGINFVLGPAHIVKEIFDQRILYKELNKTYIVEPFRVLYSTDPKFQLNLQDLNENVVPDAIEDAVRQLQLAQVIFHDMYKFPKPLDSEKYNQVKYIDVFVVSSDQLQNLTDMNIAGLTSPKILPALRKFKFDHTLKIFLRSDRLRSTTPTHEYFHLIQFGMLPTVQLDGYYLSFPHHSWLTEGTAEWSEDAIDVRKKMYKKLSKDQIIDNLEDKALTQIYFHSDGKLYREAVTKLFGPFIELCGEKDKFSESSASQFKYLSGELIMHDREIYGAALIREFFSCISESTPNINTTDISYYDRKAKICFRSMLEACVEEKLESEK